MIIAGFFAIMAIIYLLIFQIFRPTGMLAEMYKTLYGYAYFAVLVLGICVCLFYFGAPSGYDLVVAFDNGRPVEENKVNKMLKSFCGEMGMRRIHFHSLRHTSITEKLRQSGGDIKSVQGDAGHNTAKMVTDQYAEIQDEPRRDLARKMDRMGTGNAHPIHGSYDFADKDVELACEMLCQNPALASMLIAASSSMMKC